MPRYKSSKPVFYSYLIVGVLFGMSFFFWSEDGNDKVLLGFVVSISLVGMINIFLFDDKLKSQSGQLERIESLLCKLDERTTQKAGAKE